MTFGGVISRLLGVWFIYLGVSEGTSFYWTGYMGAVPPDRRGPTIPRWIGMPLFICIGLWLVYYSVRHFAH
jgi:membrane associated rhomboid family serine protease